MPAPSSKRPPRRETLNLRVKAEEQTKHHIVRHPEGGAQPSAGATNPKPLKALTFSVPLPDEWLTAAAAAAPQARQTGLLCH